MIDLQRILSILGEIRYRLVRIGYVLVPIFAFLITFQLVPFTVRLGPWAVPFAYPWPNLFYNVSAQVFRGMVATMLPPGVELLNLGVGDSVMVEMEVGLLLTLIFGMPWIVHEVGAFLSPALRRNERQLIRQIGIPGTALFATGTLIGAFLLTPFTFLILLRYIDALGLAQVMSAQSFVTFVLLYSLGFGVVFELPVFIYALTRLRLVRAATWRKHWRIAVIGCLVFGMIITPDNSGITMLLIAVPMMALYFGGAYFASQWERRQEAPPRRPRTALSG
ncbi:MAG: twin-arginine translocase subunit TatC [Thermoplasmata archaeon]